MLFCAGFLNGKNWRAKVFPIIFPALFPVWLWMSCITTAAHANLNIKGFVGFGAGGLWDGGTQKTNFLETFSRHNFSEELCFPGGANRFAGTITAGFLYSINTILFGPYIDATYIPDAEDSSRLFIGSGIPTVFGNERPNFRWTIGLEFGYPMDRLTPFVRAGFSREEVRWYAKNLYSPNEGTGEHVYANGISFAGGLNYALGPQVQLGTSFEMKFFPKINVYPPHKPEYDDYDLLYSIKNNNLSFLISARYLFGQA